ncbi:reverse transcriptase domain-containing protein, partial [Thiolapillus sp.]|uniref:reverse transcriptase domain-containing protein n=1 Tax=Thiolapillus sp. TaxID=2017437 RepID=UPI003AF6709F
MKRDDPKESNPSTPRRQHGHRKGAKKVHNIEAGQADGDSDFDALTFNDIKVSSMQSSRDEAFVTVNVKLTSRPGIHSLILKVDTGAQGNTLPLATFRKMFPDKLDRNGLPQQEIAKAARDIKLTAYNGTNIPCLGIWSFQCKFQQSRWENTKFHIVDVQGPAVIGLPSSESLKIVTLHCSIKAKPDQGTTTKLAPITSVQDLMRAYPDQFDRIGSLPGEAKLVVDPSVPTHIDPPRKTPIALKDSIKQELDKMEKSGVIRRVTEPTDWVSSLAYSHKKGGDLRVCLDPRHLNKALKRPHHKTPTVEELTHKFSGAKVFSKLDAKSGYWSVQLDTESQLLTTFQSPFGRYCFQRLPFGLSVSQDIFQLKMDQILEQVDGTVGIADDVAVYAKDDKEHDKV